MLSPAGSQEEVKRAAENKDFSSILSKLSAKDAQKIETVLSDKKATEKIAENWDEVSDNIEETFDNIGVIKAEKEYLGGISAQYESEVVYHNMLDYIKDKGIIFLDTDTAIKKYPELFKKYFNKLVNYKENKFWQSLSIYSLKYHF